MYNTYVGADLCVCPQDKDNLKINGDYKEKR